MSDGRVTRANDYRRAIRDILQGHLYAPLAPSTAPDRTPRGGVAGVIEGVPDFSIVTSVTTDAGRLRSLMDRAEDARLTDGRRFAAAVRPVVSDANPLNSIAVISLRTFAQLLEETP